MATTPLASIIRQPLGPSSVGFNTTPTVSINTSNGPPTADSESMLRRSNTVGNTRHQPSHSISSMPAASSAFHGNRSKSGTSRFRSGSLSSGNGGDPGLVRKGSGRAVRQEEVVEESIEEGTTEVSSWGKGLSRQSSLPSRRGFNPTTMPPPPEPVPQHTPANPPPRPPRRISINPGTGSLPQGPVSAHSASHSLSSLAMISPPTGYNLLETPAPSVGAGVSRTQSLRAQAKHVDGGGLGRSASMKASGEHHRSMQAMSVLSPPTDPNTPHHLFTPPSPPPVSSSAAFPPFQLPNTGGRNTPTEGADLKRHQSLTQGYGSNSRVRERLERSPGMLTLQRDQFGRLSDSGKLQDQPPTSPIGHSVWSPAHTGDDGWNRPNTQNIQDAFQAMNLGVMNDSAAGNNVQQRSLDRLKEPQPQQHVSNIGAQYHNIGDEPSWLTNLVGHAERVSPQPVRTASAPQWNDRAMYPRTQPGQPQPGQMPPPWLGQQPYLGQPFGQVPYQNLLQPNFGQPGTKNGPTGPQGQFNQPPFPGYLGQAFNPMYPSPPGTAPLPSEDASVIELAKSKGLNPASFDCRPAQARFFVIKSYTEEDVQKSLKHEIWSSTVLGNKRLDGAFRESGDKMPIYLFFSVNGSRHFCGVARMLTPVDDKQSSNVWSLDNKWKGIFKVKWIFVRDVPTPALRHIRLINTPEQKPITNSRDTQELHYEAGCEVLQIFLDYQTKSKTSLLQDFAYYERLSANRPPSAAGQHVPPASAPPQPGYGGPSNQQQLPPHLAMPPPPLPMNMQMGGSMSGVPPVPAIPTRFR